MENNWATFSYLQVASDSWEVFREEDGHVFMGAFPTEEEAIEFIQDQEAFWDETPGNKKMKTKWIFSASMRRSASTLHYHLIREVVRIADGIGIGWRIWQDFEKAFNEFDGKYPFVVLKTHAFIPKFVPLAQQLFDDNRALAFCVHRDPRDIAASLISGNRFAKDWNVVIENIPAILQEYNDWASLSKEKILISKYETLCSQLSDFTYDEYKANLLSLTTEIRKIRDFLGLLSFEIQIAQRHTLSAHKKVIENTNYQGTKHHPETLFWKNHLDSGEIGRYKNELTQSQINEIEAIDGATEWLKQRGYNEISDGHEIKSNNGDVHGITED